MELLEFGGSCCLLKFAAWMVRDHFVGFLLGCGSVELSACSAGSFCFLFLLPALICGAGGAVGCLCSRACFMLHYFS